MTTHKTENREYNIPQAGETNWHIPVNENWQAIDADMQAALELASGERSSIKGISKSMQNVGALVHGGFHSSAYPDGGYGITFEASDLYIDSVVVQSDLTNVTDSDLTVELRRFEGGAVDPPIVESTTVTLSGGIERIPIGFTVPAEGAPDADANNEYTLQRGDGEDIPLRRRHEDDGHWSAADYADHTYTDPAIDFLHGVNNAASSSSSRIDDSWYYFFDWLVGPEDSRVTSPRSTDVDEIYMRPTDPEEEFDDVSPRALWIDTSTDR